MPLELLLVLSTEDSKISDLHAISAAAASQTKGDSDPFLEFLILLYFVTDCEELCDAKCTV